MDKPTKQPAALEGEGKPIDDAKELNELLARLKEYVPAAALGVGLALVIFVGMTYVRHSRQAAREEAEQLYATAQQAEQFQEVIDRFPNSPVAPAALLALASERFAEGLYDLARVHYRQFLADFPDHPMRPAAELGLAYCDEAEGLLDEALQAHVAFVAQYPDYYLMPVALLAQGRILANVGQFDAAREIYEGILADEDHPWWAHAENQRAQLDKMERAAKRQ